MNTVVYLILTVLLLMVGILILMRQDAANKSPVVEPDAHGPATKEQGEDHFSALLNSITPVWYWRVNHEYMDFINATVKRMRFDELNATPGLFEAQRRCSDLNSAVYKYYENIKKRCLNGELVLLSDIEVLNMRHCFHEFSLEAYPALVALVWPEYARPEVNPADV